MSERRADSATGSEAETDLLTAFQRHHGALKHFIARYLSNQHDIEDVAQESFLRAFRAGMDYSVKQPKSFLFRIAKNVAVSQLRMKSRQITSSIEEQSDFELLDSEWTLEEDVMARERLSIQCEALASLPPQCRRVYILRKVHGLSHKEIAERLGIGQKTVEKHLYKGIAACDHYVRDRFSGDDQNIQHSDNHKPSKTHAVNQSTAKESDPYG